MPTAFRFIGYGRVTDMTCLTALDDVGILVRMSFGISDFGWDGVMGCCFLKSKKTNTIMRYIR